ncbi:MAG TPA: hypothetical protein VK623_01370 [Flavobacterium sp.]|nr:hypothetical protein [Flavobacterium sp.]
MKIFTILFLTLFLSKGCDGDAQKDLKGATIEYTANTRGFYRKVIVKDQVVFVSADRNEQAASVATKISDADLKLLVDAFSDINLDEIADLKSPTEKRFYDGAAIANLKITYKGKTYESAAFDHGNPPVEIEKLADKLVSFIKEEE